MANRLVAVVDPLGNRTSFGYDAAGRQVSMANGLGFVSSTVFDAASRAIATVDPLGNAVSFGYDAANRRVSTTDPLGNTNTAVFDAGNRLVASVDPLGNDSSTRLRRGQSSRRAHRSAGQPQFDGL